MPPHKIMSINERRTYLRIMAVRYAQANKAEQAGLLDEMQVVTQLHRKSLIRLLHSDLSRQPRQKQRGSTFGPEVDDALRLITESYDYPCPERLATNLATMARQLARHGEMTVTPDLLEKLDQISSASIYRIERRLFQDQPRLRPVSSNGPALTHDIPMTVIPWDTTDPGHFEVDLVHHSGPRMGGQYTYTLQLADVATGWSERFATLGRSYQRLQDAFGHIQGRLPFTIRELHPDNGGEFLNAYLLEFWRTKIDTAVLSRSRPYHKNDNRFVEQRNQSHVRAYLGDQRFDTITQTLAINRLYEKLWVYNNLFQPAMRLIAKESVSDGAGHITIRRRYDDARPPFDRLCTTTAISTEHRERLERVRDDTNPRRLRAEIYSLIDRIMDMPCADQLDTE